jgi:hypothetical protein
VRVTFTPPSDPRVTGVLVLRSDGTTVCTSPQGTCYDRRHMNGTFAGYDGVTIDHWGMSQPLVANPIRLSRGGWERSP